MSVTLNAYINFDGQAAEALEFYKSVFGGEVHSDTFRSFASDEMPVPEQDLDKIMHGYLKGDNGIELMIADAMSTMEKAKGSQIQLSLSGDDETTLRGYWSRLSEDGTIALPLYTAPWGAIFGIIKDKYGIDWMVNIGGKEQ